jgi:hypothetical protein
MADNTFIQKPLGITLTFFGFLWGMCVLVLDWTGRLDALKHLLPEEAYSYLASVKLPLLPFCGNLCSTPPTSHQCQNRLPMADTSGLTDLINTTAFVGTDLAFN